MVAKLGIVGVGAIGGVLGGYLTRAGRDVTLIDQWPENVETINQHGLTVTTQDEQFTVPARAMHLCDVSAAGPTFDAVFLAVKSYDTEWAARFIAPYLAPAGFIVSAQNSVNDPTIAGIVGWSRVIGCVITLSAAMYDPGHAERTSSPDRPGFAVGEPSGMVTPRLKAIADILSAAGQTRVTTNLWGERWAKLAQNCMGNAVSGISGLTSAEIRQRPETRRLIVEIASEAVQAGTALGVAIEAISGVPAARYVDAVRDGAAFEEVGNRLTEGSRLLGTGRPSLAQDLRKGRKTEIDYLNGYVVRKGIEAGTPTRVNGALVGLTKRMETRELEPSVDNLRELV